MAVGVSGCVVTEQNSMTMKYKKKCDFCNYVESGQTLTSLVKPGQRSQTVFRCPKCGKNNTVLIQG